MIETAVVAAAKGGLSPATLTFVQTVAVGGLVFLGQYVVAKLSNKAQEKGTDVDSQSKATEAWQKYAEEMKTRLDSLESRLTSAEERVRLLETQSARDLDLLRRVVYRFRKVLADLRHLGVSAHIEDEELLDLVQIRLDRDTTE